MPSYTAIRQQGIFTLSNGIRVFAGTVSDPFFIGLGANFDSLNFRAADGGGILPPTINANDDITMLPMALAGFNVNSIVLEVPITMLTFDGQQHLASDAAAVIGTWGMTSRQRISVLGGSGTGGRAQVQALGQPLINEVIIGTGSKDRFSMDIPANDQQFSSFFLNPLLASVLSSIGVPVPPAPRTDLLLLVQYMAPICPGCPKNGTGPIADLLRLNTGIPPAAPGTQKRLGSIAGDMAGFPNGRRPFDDVVDGVNISSSPLQTTFPFLGTAYQGRDNAHNGGPGRPGCNNSPGRLCPVN